MFTEFLEKQQSQPELKASISNLNDESNPGEFDAFLDQLDVLEAIDALVNAYQEICATHNQ